MVIFDPPRRPPRNPQKFPILTILTTFGHFWDSWFLTIFRFENEFRPQKPPKLPFLAKIDPPRRPPQSKNPGKWPFWRKPGFSSMIWTAKRGGGGGGLPRDPPKRPFLAIFDHFWPFLAILATFWPFSTPQKISPPRIPKFGCKMWAGECERKWRILAIFGQKRERNPPRNPPGQTDYI